MDRRFVDSLVSLAPVDAHRCWKAVARFQDDPDHPGLNFERLGGNAGKNRLCSIRASLELRILLAVDGSTAVLLRAGHHDRIYELAARSTFVAPAHSSPGLIGIDSETRDLDGAVVARRPEPTIERAPEPGILDHWATSELQEAGFSDPQISLLRGATLDNLLEVWSDIDDEQLSLILELVELSPEEWRRADAGEEDERFRSAVLERGALSGLSGALTAEELEHLASAPIEDWMVFLHPSQRELVERAFPGPARIRGSAGTGKTVVALHRAARLARVLQAEQPHAPPILFTTYIKNLPPVFENLFRRLPQATGDRVVFTNVDKLAHGVCANAGVAVVHDPRVVSSEFNNAYIATVGRGSALAQLGLTRDYIREEIVAVVKGRAISALDEYLAIDRTGRRTPLGREARSQIWELKEAWDQRLAAEGVMDFVDVINRAVELAPEVSGPRFSAAIVDEAQDLTLASLRLIQALLPDEGPDRLLLVGDGAQRIYPGGFTLREAGLDIRGKSAVLRLNYRNTDRIIDSARACVGSEEVFDLAEEFRRGDELGEVTRTGLVPLCVAASSVDEQLDWVSNRINELIDMDAAGPGDIAVCAPTNRLVRSTVKALEGAGLRVQSLESFDGVPNDRVKVGTFHRAKGLEFKAVFIPGLSDSSFPGQRRPGQSDSEYEEQRSRQLSQLFVAMTRARDRLVVLYDGKPAEAVAAAIDTFEQVDL